MIGTLALILVAVLALYLISVAVRASRENDASTTEVEDSVVLLEPELAGAELVFVEKLFKCDSPYPVNTRVDRVYQLSNGLHVPLEKKTRKSAKVYDSDILQLSLQAYILRRNGKETEKHGYVFFEEASKVEKVTLMDDPECENAISSHIALLAGKRKPKKSIGPKCKKCAYEAECSKE